MLIDRINMETTDRRRYVSRLDWWLDPGETLTDIVSSDTSLGTTGWSVAPFAPPGSPPPYDPTPVLMSAALDETGTQLIVFLEHGTPGNAYTCTFVLQGESDRKITLELVVQVTGVPPYHVPPIPMLPETSNSALPITGGQMEGPLYLFRSPQYPTEAATKDYVDHVVGATGGPFLSLSGGTMTGTLTLVGDPGGAEDAATKHYVDSVVSLAVGGVSVGPSPPTNPMPGAEWWDSAGGQLYIWYQDVNSAQWVIANNDIGSVFVGAAPPAKPVPGMEWFDSVGGNLYVWYQDVNSAQWVVANNSNPTVVVSDTPPAQPVPGELWWSSTDGNLYLRYQDINTSQWVIANSVAGTSAGNIVNVLSQGAKGDGVTDDTAAIQNALNAYAGRAIVFVPDTGHPYMVNPLVPPTGTDLLIHGTLMGRPGVTNGVLVVQNCQNVTVRGHGTVDANDSITGNGALVGIAVANATNVRISGITIQNAGYWNLNVTGSTDVIVDSVRMFGGTNSPEFAAGSTDCWLTNSYINGPTKDGGFAFYGGVTNSGAIGNVFTNALYDGCSVVSDSAQPAQCTGIVISNNVIFGNGAQAIVVVASGVGGQHTNITISDNVCYNNGTKPSVFPYPNCDIFLASCWYSKISGNHLRQCQNNGHGIVVSGFGYGGCVGLTLTGNSITQEGQGAHTGIGIWLAGATHHILISGNYIYDDQTPPTMQYAITGNLGTQTSIVGNHFSGFNPALSIVPQSDTVVANTNSSGGLFNIPYGTLSVVNPMQFTNSNIAPRWFMGNGLNTESGGNTGSDFEIVRAADNGTILDAPIYITRSTGAVTIKNSLGVWGATPPASKPAVTGAKGGSTLLGSLLSALAGYGLITDNTTA